MNIGKREVEKERERDTACTFQTLPDSLFFIGAIHTPLAI
jgi:hypothetical protein